jgi:hypothetical protein
VKGGRVPLRQEGDQELRDLTGLDMVAYLRVEVVETGKERAPLS